MNELFSKAQVASEPTPTLESSPQLKPRRRNTPKFVDQQPEPEVELDTQAEPEAEQNLGSEQEEPKYSTEELLEVFDNLMFRGVYKETYPISKRLTVTFKTRTAEESFEVAKKVDAMTFNYEPTFLMFKAQLNLSYSLTAYGPQDFKGASSEERMKFLNSLPVFVVSLLADKLAEFDSKVQQACIEGQKSF